ncbi:MAG: alpha/beta hydrolase [Myxococcota bacterium]
MISELTFETETFETFDGLRLRTARWSAPEATRGPVLFCTGRNESLERYEEMARGFIERGFRPVAFDWRGQGGSGRETEHPRRGHVSHFDAYLRDLRDLLAELLRGEQPVVVAHSMGAHLALRYAHDEPLAFRALVLSAPMIAIQTGPLPLSAVGWLARVSRWAGAGEAFLPGHRRLFERAKRFKRNPLTNDKERFERNIALLEEHPELITGGVTFGWLAEAVISMQLALEPGFPEAIQTPTLLLTAGADTVVRRSVQGTFAGRMPNATHQVIEGAKHELLQETDACLAQVWTAIDAFLPTAPARDATIGL